MDGWNGSLDTKMVGLNEDKVSLNEDKVSLKLDTIKGVNIVHIRVYILYP